jgi:2-polyprenyl-6-methoxyphenol hydroxylase-like FAD-dependent oxidoreductase
MQQTYTYPEFAYTQSPEQQAGEVKRHPVVIIGAGPIGLTQALDCAARGLACVVLDDNNTVSIGSRAVCYAKRPLEVWDRLGVGEGFADRGVQLEGGQGVLPQRAGLPVRPAARKRPQAAGHDQPAAILPGREAGGDVQRISRWSTCAGSTSC